MDKGGESPAPYIGARVGGRQQLPPVRGGRPPSIVRRAARTGERGAAWPWASPWATTTGAGALTGAATAARRQLVSKTKTTLTNTNLDNKILDSDIFTMQS